MYECLDEKQPTSASIAQDDEKKRATRYTKEQKSALEKHYCLQKFLTPESREMLRTCTGLEIKQINKWFANRRQRSIDSEGVIFLMART